MKEKMVKYIRKEYPNAIICTRFKHIGMCGRTLLFYSDKTKKDSYFCSCINGTLKIYK